MFPITKTIEFPPHLKPLYKKALRYEWLSFFYMVSASLFSFLVISNSQTMKTIWLEDLLGVIPPASFLITSKILKRRPNKYFAYGFHKITGIAFLTSALALFSLGAYLLVDGLWVLMKKEHPDIPTITVFGTSLWFGYIMIVALLWSSLPSTILGHIKIPLAEALYDKTLFTDSKMNKASWMSGFASIFGILGIGMGYWWADALMAVLISTDILYDGYKQVKQAVLDLIGEIPKTLDEKKVDPLIQQVKHLVAKESWVKEVEVRFRDEGHVFFGEIFIVPREKQIDLVQLNHLREKIMNFHWRLLDIVVMPISP